MAVEDFVGSAVYEVVGISAVDKCGAQAQDLAESFELESAELMCESVGKGDGLEAIDQFGLDQSVIKL